MYRQEYKFGRRPHFVEPVGGFNPVEHGHGYVQYNYVWLKPLGFGEQVPSIICGPDHVKLWVQERQHAIENDRVIVCDQHLWPSQGMPLFPDTHPSDGDGPRRERPNERFNLKS